MLHQMNLHAAGALQRELEDNAEMCGYSAKELVQTAPYAMTLLGHRLQTWADAVIAIDYAGISAGFDTTSNLDIYRKANGIRVHEGLAPGDLGGLPAGDLLIRASVSDRLLRKAAEMFATRGPGETWGFLVWSFSRLLNSVREDFPGGTLGVASARETDFMPVFGPSPNPDVRQWIYFLSNPEPTS